MNVIVVDDDEDTVRLFSQFLEENGIKVIGSAFDGKTAVDVFRKVQPDVTLIDIMMPNGTGIYAIRKIQEIQPDTKIIAVTADTSSETEEKLTKLNIPVIYKPFDMAQIISAIQQ